LIPSSAVAAVDSNEDLYEVRASVTLKEPVFFLREIDPGLWVVSKNGVLHQAIRRPEYDWWFGGEYWELKRYETVVRRDVHVGRESTKPED